MEFGVSCLDFNLNRLGFIMNLRSTKVPWPQTFHIVDTDCMTLASLYRSILWASNFGPFRFRWCRFSSSESWSARITVANRRRFFISCYHLSPVFNQSNIPSWSDNFVPFTDPRLDSKSGRQFNQQGRYPGGAKRACCKEREALINQSVGVPLERNRRLMIT